jgi:hypothetical protein
MNLLIIAEGILAKKLGWEWKRVEERIRIVNKNWLNHPYNRSIVPPWVDSIYYSVGYIVRYYYCYYVCVAVDNYESVPGRDERCWIEIIDPNPKQQPPPPPPAAAAAAVVANGGGRSQPATAPPPPPTPPPAVAVAAAAAVANDGEQSQPAPAPPLPSPAATAYIYIPQNEPKKVLLYN